jgi:phenylalanine-4-hydroxylase
MTLAAAAPHLIEQKYQDYTAEQKAVWAELVRRWRPQIEAFACEEYLEGSKIIGLEEDRLPNLIAITEILKPRTGWSTTPVSGFLPSDVFFEMLNDRQFPVTARIRSRDSLEYTSEPDVFTMSLATSPCTRTKCSPTSCSTTAPYAHKSQTRIPVSGSAASFGTRGIRADF